VTGECHEDRCVTCGDIALEVTVLRLLDDDMALVAVPLKDGPLKDGPPADGPRADGGTGQETVSVALVSARVGDTLLVHAGEAIGVVGR
jgi:hydrogenase expression/formation protein HypC